MTKVCIKCGIEKDLEEFTKSDRCVDGHLGICKNCRNEYLRKWRKTEKVEKVEKVEFVIPNSKICKRCGIEKSMEEFYKRYSTKDHHVGVCKKCEVERTCKIYQDNKPRGNLNNRKSRAKRRGLVFSHYGNKCVCCGETIDPFLSIDHINGGGTQHRKEVGNIYTWLIKNNFPEGFRILCMNCQFGYKRLGYCPHHPEGKT